MKKGTKILILIAFIIVAGTSFMAGSYIKEQEYLDGREERCKTLITFAIDKAENQDLSDPDIMEALISNVYAAYQVCDESTVAAQLHELWNALIIEGEGFIGREDELIEHMRNIVEYVSTLDES